MVLARRGRDVNALARQARHVRSLGVHELCFQRHGLHRSRPVRLALGRGLWTVVEAVGPIVPARSAAAFAGYGQVGLRFAPGALGFKWNKVSPVTGIKRIFSVRGAWEISKMARAW